MTAFAQGGYQDGVDYYNAERFDKAKTILEKTLNDPSTKKAVSYFYLGSLELAIITSQQLLKTSTRVCRLTPHMAIIM